MKKEELNKYQFLGVNLQTPIIIGSGPLSFNADGMIKLHKAGAGAVVTKTIRLNSAVNPLPHISKSGRDTLINCEKWSDFLPDKWIDEEIPKAKAAGVVCIVSIGHTLEECKALVKKVEEAGADFIELVSYNEADMLPMIKYTKSNVNIPVIAKLSPSIASIGQFAKKCEEAGADAITACDSVGPVLRIDIKTGKPMMASNDGYGWLSGAMIKPIILQKISEIRKCISCPIIGLGGCVNGEDGIEMIMAGADLVGICSIPMLKGSKVINEIHKSMISLMEKYNYDSIEAIKGIIFRTKPAGEQLEPYKFEYDSEKCSKCNLCVDLCPYSARILTEDKKMLLNEEECRYCGLCASICPPKALEINY